MERYRCDVAYSALDQGIRYYRIHAEVYSIWRGGETVKFLVTGPVNYDYSYSVVKTLRSFGHEVEFYPMCEFYVQASYWQRKLYKLGFASLRKRYEQEWEAGLLKQAEIMRPDYVLVLNGAMLTKRLLVDMSSLCSDVVLWLWDGLSRFGWKRVEELMPHLSCIAVFEYEDLEKFEGWQGKKIYLPLGYDEDIYEHTSSKKRDIDIAFVGMPSEERVLTLDAVAAYAAVEGRRLFVGGQWYDMRFWKKARYRRKHPQLYPFIENRLLSFDEVASIYKRSRICLNIGVAEHHSINPRAFELVASETLQIMKAGQEMHGRLRMGEDLLQYRDIPELLHLLEQFLQDEPARSRIAAHGYSYNKEHNSMRAVVNELLTAVLDA